LLYASFVLFSQSICAGNLTTFARAHRYSFGADVDASATVPSGELVARLVQQLRDRFGLAECGRMLVAADPAAVPLDDIVTAQYSRALDPQTGKIDFNSVYGSFLVSYIAAAHFWSQTLLLLFLISPLTVPNLGSAVMFGGSRRFGEIYVREFLSAGENE
jgi:hypothetical protein